MYKLSVIIVNYNSKYYLNNCIRSIIDHTHKLHYEIIVVDNASSDGSVYDIQNNYPGIKIIENKANLGFGKASNIGMKNATGENIVLVNNDVVLINDALSKMADFMGSNIMIGALTCKIYEKDGKAIQTNCRAFPAPLDTIFGRSSLMTKLFPNNSRSKKNLLYDWDYDSVREIDWASGAILMVKKEVIKKIGMLDEKYFMFWEDTDWCKRMKDAGWRIFFLPDAKVIHYAGSGGGARSIWLKLYIMYQMHRSAYYYFRKHYYKNALHPMAILLFFGMISLIIFKGCYEIIVYLLLAVKGA